MLIVHFYDGIKNVYSVWANSVSDVIENPQNYYHEYKEGMFITEAKLKHPIIKDRILREMNKEECVFEGIEIDLEEGEIIRDRKLRKIHRPSKYHVWNGKEWKIDLVDVKNKKREELKIIREKKISSHLKVQIDKEYEFQMKNNDVNNFLGFKSTLDTLKMLGVDKPEDISKLSAFHLPEEILKKIKTFLETGKVGWILTNNSIALFSFEQILLINTLYQLRKEEIFIEFGKLSMQLEKCKSTEEIEKIVWE
ncbi:hypothetical protein A2U17_00315 [Fusobacterium necrophorum subsp. funduliforme]|uniref:hypothetical protein n=1 Tax=Fusobacterium necrophorum TaxID=859 RepID=UPI000787DCB0|nr:hypothetical protein [Fusobacterium necrophorum]KYM56244.1 hypothetical protein A2U17_00315 [Fusobacterium necrophorum subsp. funduliforme]